MKDTWDPELTTGGTGTEYWVGGIWQLAGEMKLKVDLKIYGIGPHKPDELFVLL